MCSLMLMHTYIHRGFHMYVYMTCCVEFIKLFWHTNNTAKQKAKKNYNNDGARAWRIIAYMHACIHTPCTYINTYMQHACALFVFDFYCRMTFAASCLRVCISVLVCVCMSWIFQLIFFFAFSFALSKRKPPHTCRIQFLNISCPACFYTLCTCSKVGIKYSIKPRMSILTYVSQNFLRYYLLSFYLFVNSGKNLKILLSFLMANL